MTQMNTDEKSTAETRDSQTYAIIGAAMAVHGQPGPGFLESVYQEALTVELEIAQVPFRREVPIEIWYRDRVLECKYKADFVCHDSIIVELKAVDRLDTVHQAQVINYLKATGIKRALLFNFGASRLEYKRLALDYDQRPSASSADETKNGGAIGR